MLLVAKDPEDCRWLVPPLTKLSSNQTACHVLLARKCREVCALFSISGSGGRAG